MCKYKYSILFYQKAVRLHLTSSEMNYTQSMTRRPACRRGLPGRWRARASRWRRSSRGRLGSGDPVLEKRVSLNQREMQQVAYVAAAAAPRLQAPCHEKETYT